MKTAYSLYIISDTPHWIKNNLPYGWGPTVIENDTLAGLFQEVKVLGIKHSGLPPHSTKNYQATNLHTLLLPPAGGSNLLEKLKSLPVTFIYVCTLVWLLYKSSQQVIFFVRAPCQIALLYLLVHKVFGKKTWVKYAGNWDPHLLESKSYQLQKKILISSKHIPAVTVNGIWPDQKIHIITFENPSLFRSEIQNWVEPSKSSQGHCEFIFVGRIEKEKGIYTLLEIAEVLARRKFPYTLHIVGKGKDEKYILPHLAELKNVVYHQSLSRENLIPLYKKCHFFVFPSQASEGWPKVLTEALFYGCIPIVPKLSSIPSTCQELGVGVIIENYHAENWANVIEKLWKEGPPRQDPKGTVSQLDRFTYEYFAEAVHQRVLPRLLR